MITIELKFKESDFDKNGVVKISTLLRCMQNAATTDAEQYGSTHENLWKDNMFFAVFRNILKIKNNITTETKKATIVSFQSFHDRMRFIRSYFIYTNDKIWDKTSEKSPYEDADIYCDSIWVLMDAYKRTLLRATDLKYPVEEYTIPFERPFKVIIEKENATKLGEFIGNNYYIDENEHVNNTAYADIVSDFSSLDKAIKYFDVTYEHEILENSTVEIFSEKSENEEKLLGIRKSDQAVCFVVQVKNNI